jgi:hypothetical protein
MIVSLAISIVQYAYINYVINPFQQFSIEATKISAERPEDLQQIPFNLN